MVDLTKQTESPEEQARLWVIKMDGETFTADDHQRLQQWLAQSASHREAYDQARQTWGLLDDWASAGNQPLPDDLAVEVEQALVDIQVPDGVEFLDDQLGLEPEDELQPERTALVEQQPPKEEQPPQIQSVARPKLWGWETRHWSAAAVLVLMLTFAVTALMPLPEGHYRTGKGERLTQQLADGSTLMLNTDSYVAVEYSAGERRIVLRAGEAYFDVAHDKNRPFVVYAGDGKVRAVGTAFNVYKTDGQVAVTVTEGTVEVTATADQVADSDLGIGASKRVTANQSLIYKEQLGLVTHRDAQEIDRRLAWRRDKLYFDNVTLSAFVEQLNRYSSNRLMILDPGLKDLRVGGVFKAGDTQAALQALEAAFAVETVSVTPFLTLLYKGDSETL